MGFFKFFLFAYSPPPFYWGLRKNNQFSGDRLQASGDGLRGSGIGHQASGDRLQASGDRHKVRCRVFKESEDVGTEPNKKKMFFHAQFGLVRCSPTASGAAERMFEHGRRSFFLFGGFTHESREGIMDLFKEAGAF